MNTTPIDSTSFLFSFAGIAVGMAVIPFLATVCLRAMQSRVASFSASVPRGIWRAALATSFLFLLMELSGASTVIAVLAHNSWNHSRGGDESQRPADSPAAGFDRQFLQTAPSAIEDTSNQNDTASPRLWDDSGEQTGSAVRHGGLHSLFEQSRLETPPAPLLHLGESGAKPIEALDQRDDGLVSDLGQASWGHGHIAGGEQDHAQANAQVHERSGEPAKTAASPWTTVLLSVWFGVSLVLAFRLIAAHLYWQRLGQVVQQGTPLLGRVNTIWRELRGRQRVRVIETNRVATPVAFGLLQPAIAIPPSFGDTLSLQQQDVVLAHELAHLASGDPLWQAAGDVLCILLWWHPAVWWLRFRMREASEFAADESSTLLPGGPHLLAAALVKLARNLSAEVPLAAVPLSGRFRSTLSRRVMRLLSQSRTLDSASRRRPRWVCSVAIVLLLAAATTCAAWGRPQAIQFSERSNMRLLKNSWSRSIAAAAVMTLTSISGGEQVFANANSPAHLDDEREERAEREEQERAERQEREERAEREEGEEQERAERQERERGADRERGGRERDRDRRDRPRDPSREEIERRNAELHEHLNSIERQLSRENTPGNREELERAADKVRGEIREIGMHLRRRGPRDERRADPERGARRRQVLSEAIDHLLKSGFEEEANHLRQLLGDDVPRPGFHPGEPEHEHHAHSDHEHAHPGPEHREPGNELARMVHELAQHVERLNQELQEVRNHLREIRPDHRPREIREREERREREDRRGPGEPQVERVERRVDEGGR